MCTPMPDVDMSEVMLPDTIENRLDRIEAQLAEFVTLFRQLAGFVEQAKGNPMLAAMLGGMPRK